MNCISPFSQHASTKKKVHLPLQECAMGAGPPWDLPLLCGEAASGPRHAHLWLRTPPQSQRLPRRGEFCRLRWKCTWKKNLGWLQICYVCDVNPAAFPALPGGPVPGFVGLRRCRREEAQLLHHLVLLLVSLCQLLHPDLPVPQEHAQPSPEDLCLSPLLLWPGGQPWEGRPEDADQGWCEDLSDELQRCVCVCRWVCSNKSFTDGFILFFFQTFSIAGRHLWIAKKATLKPGRNCIETLSALLENSTAFSR